MHPVLYNASARWKTGGGSAGLVALLTCARPAPARAPLRPTPQPSPTPQPTPPPALLHQGRLQHKGVSHASPLHVRHGWRACAHDGALLLCASDAGWRAVVLTTHDLCGHRGHLLGPGRDCRLSSARLCGGAGGRGTEKGDVGLPRERGEGVPAAVRLTQRSNACFWSVRVIGLGWAVGET